MRAMPVSFSIFVLKEPTNSVLQTMQLIFTYLKTLKLHIFPYS
jgi:hypothetical protein